MNSLIRCFAMAKTAPQAFQLPSLVYIRTLSAEEGIPFPTATRRANEYLEGPFREQRALARQTDLQQSDVYYGMYNAVVDLDGMINLKDVVDRVILDDFETETHSGVTYELLKVVGRTGKFRDVMEITPTYGLKKKSEGTPNSIDFTIRMNKNQGASVTIFSSGRIRFSGGYLQTNKNEPKLLLKFMEKFVDIPENVRINFNNVTCEYKMSMKPDLEAIFRLFDKAITKGLATYDGIKIESELASERGQAIVRGPVKKQTPFLYLKFLGQFTVILSNSTVVQLEGNTNVIRDVPFVKKFMEGLKNGLMLEGNYRMTNISPKATKISKIKTNLPAPEVTRRGTTCPVGHRPEPYSFQGKCPKPNHFVKPNPQGQPCCYKIPKDITYSRPKIAEAYRKAGVKVPDDVIRIFGVGADTEDLHENVSKANANIYTYSNEKSGFKIGSRQCTRYTKVALMDIAKRMNIEGIPKFISKPNLCEMIKEKAKEIGLNRTAGFKKGVTIIDGRVRFEKRFCDSYEKPDIVLLGTRAGVKDLDLSMTKAELCQTIKEQIKTNKRVQLRLTREQIKENLNVLFGNRKATNENVQALINFIRQKNITASPRKIQALKKEFVNSRR